MELGYQTSIGESSIEESSTFRRINRERDFSMHGEGKNGASDLNSDSCEPDLELLILNQESIFCLQCLQ